MNMPFLMTKFNRLRSTGLLLTVLFAVSGCGPSERKQAELASTPSPQSSVAATPGVESPVIVAFGNSLTAGYGLQESQSYPALLQRRLDENGYNYRVVNAGVSGDTSAGGVRRIEWALKGDVRIVILELGANDALRGQPPAGIKKNLAQIIEASQKRGAKVILAGMEALPNLGPEYTQQFRDVFQDLASEYNVTLIPFFLAGVAGIRDLNQPDGIHPSVGGTGIVVDNVWRALEPMLIKD